MLTGSSCAGGQILLCYIKSSSLKIIFSHSVISLLMLALAKDITADSDGLAAYDLQVATPPHGSCACHGWASKLQCANSGYH